MASSLKIPDMRWNAVADIDMRSSFSADTTRAAR
jgi:hypothetical protein